MDLVQNIFLISATHNFLVQFQHIPGSNNPIADALSRLQMQKFQELAPDAKPNQTPIPEYLFQLQCPDLKPLKMSPWHHQHVVFTTLVSLNSKCFARTLTL